MLFSASFNVAFKPHAFSHRHSLFFKICKFIKIVILLTTIHSYLNKNIR